MTRQGVKKCLQALQSFVSCYKSAMGLSTSPITAMGFHKLLWYLQDPDAIIIKTGKASREVNKMDRFNVDTFRTNAKEFTEKAQDLIDRARISEFLEEKKQDEKTKKIVMTVLAVIGCVAAVAAIAYAVYRFVAPDYLEDYDDYDDAFDSDDADVVPEK